MSVERISVLVLKQILLVSIPANPDDETISNIQAKVLSLMAQSGAKGVILDISTVEIVDSYFARVVVETAQMVHLIGGQTVIAGMRPSVAMTATELGLELSSLITALDVDQAFDTLTQE